VGLVPDSQLMAAVSMCLANAERSGTAPARKLAGFFSEWKENLGETNWREVEGCPLQEWEIQHSSCHAAWSQEPTLQLPAFSSFSPQLVVFTSLIHSAYAV